MYHRIVRLSSRFATPQGRDSPSDSLVIRLESAENSFDALKFAARDLGQYSRYRGE